MPFEGAPLGGAAAAALIAMSVVGAATALAGLWLLLRRLDAGRAVPAGMLALGTVLIGLTLLVALDRGPAPGPAEALPPVIVGEGMVVSREGGRTVATRPPPDPPPPLPGRPATTIAIEASEAEPNDNLAAANLARLGTAIDGTLGPGDRDWFAFNTTAARRSQLVANVIVRDASVSLSLFDDAGQRVATATTFEDFAIRNTTVERKLDRPRYYVLVQALDGPEASYQLTVAARRR